MAIPHACHPMCRSAVAPTFCSLAHPACFRKALRTLFVHTDRTAVSPFLTSNQSVRSSHLLSSSEIVLPRDPHAMEAGTARLRGRPHRMLRTRVVLDCAAACDAGPATTETAARLANIHCGGRGKLRLIQCVPRTVRNGSHLQTFLTGQSLQGQSP